MSVFATERHAHLFRENLSPAVRTLEGFVTDLVTSQPDFDDSVTRRRPRRPGNCVLEWHF